MSTIVRHGASWEDILNAMQMTEAKRRSQREDLFTTMRVMDFINQMQPQEPEQQAPEFPLPPIEPQSFGLPSGYRQPRAVARHLDGRGGGGGISPGEEEFEREKELMELEQELEEPEQEAQAELDQEAMAIRKALANGQINRGEAQQAMAQNEDRRRMLLVKKKLDQPDISEVFTQTTVKDDWGNLHIYDSDGSYKKTVENPEIEIEKERIKAGERETKAQERLKEKQEKDFEKKSADFKRDDLSYKKEVLRLTQGKDMLSKKDAVGKLREVGIEPPVKPLSEEELLERKENPLGVDWGGENEFSAREKAAIRAVNRSNITYAEKVAWFEKMGFGHLISEIGR